MCYPTKFVVLFQQQAQISWDQIFASHIVQSWMYRLTHHSHKTNRTHFYAKVVQILWTFILEMWVECNKSLHDHQQTYDQMQLQLAVKQIFHDVAGTTPSTMALIEHQMSKTILTQPIKIIRQWVKWGQFYMQTQTKAVALQAKQKTRDIHSFFHPNLAIQD